MNEAEAALEQAKGISSGDAGVVPSAIGSVRRALGSVLPDSVKELAGPLGTLPSEAEAQAKFDELQRQKDQLEKAEESAKREAERKTAEAQAAKDAADEATRRFTEAQGMVNQYGGPQGKVAIDSQKITQDRQAAAQVAQIKGQSASEDSAAMSRDRAILDSRAGGMTEYAQSVLEASRGIQPGTHAAHEEVQELRQLVSDLTAELAKFTRLGISDGRSQGLREEINALKTQVSNLESTIHARQTGY